MFVSPSEEVDGDFEYVDGAAGQNVALIVIGILMAAYLAWRLFTNALVCAAVGRKEDDAGDIAKQGQDPVESLSKREKQLIITTIALLNLTGNAGQQVNVAYLPWELERHADSVYVGAVVAAWAVGSIVCTIAGPYVLRCACALARAGVVH